MVNTLFFTAEGKSTNLEREREESQFLMMMRGESEERRDEKVPGDEKKERTSDELLSIKVSSSFFLSLTFPSFILLGKIVKRVKRQ